MDSEYSQILPFLEINENYDRLIHLLGFRVTWIILKGSADTMEPIIVLIWLNILATTVLLIIFTHAHTRTHTHKHTHRFSWFISYIAVTALKYETPGV